MVIDIVVLLSTNWTAAVKSIVASMTTILYQRKHSSLPELSIDCSSLFANLCTGLIVSLSNAAVCDGCNNGLDDLW